MSALNYLTLPPLTRARFLHRGTIFAGLFLLFTWAFVLCPYWRCPLANEAHTPVLRQILFVLLSLTCAFGWAYLACPSRDEPTIPAAEPPPRRTGFPLLILIFFFAALLAYNFRALTMGIPWRGDEDQHMQNTVLLAESLLSRTGLLWFCGMLAAAIGFILLAWLHPKLNWRYVPTCLALVALQALWIICRDPVATRSLTRYPALPRWLSALPAVALSPIVKVVRPFTGHYSEAVYRLVPFLCAVGLAWIVFQHLSKPKNPIARIVAVIAGLAIGTLPLVVYYSSLLYLEMPALLLMCYALLHGEDLLLSSTARLRRLPAWYALIAIGFVKETTIPFLAAFVLLRVMAQAWHWYQNRSTSFRRAVADEIGNVICVVLPLGLYLFFRKFFPEKRGLSPDLQHLFHGSNFDVLIRSYAQQFATLLPFALIGLALMAWRRRGWWLAFCLLAMGFDVVLHLIDDEKYIGYSRFNLFVLPSLIVLAVFCIRELLEMRRWLQPIAGVTLAAAIGLNIWLSPINPNGTRKVTRMNHHLLTWGDWRMDVSEHDYPMREALQYLRLQQVRDLQPMLFTYRYGWDFYLDPQTRVEANFGTQWGGLSMVLVGTLDKNIDSAIVLVPPGENETNLDGSALKIFDNGNEVLVDVFPFAKPSNVRRHHN